VWSGSLATGTHRFQWDGRDDAGRPAAAGVYVARLSTARGTQGRKLTLVR
jgi:flagellar hook assembly protein FlgD